VFKTPEGLFKPTAMFFGLTNSLATFQMIINYVESNWYLTFDKEIKSPDFYLFINIKTGFGNFSFLERFCRS